MPSTAAPGAAGEAVTGGAETAKELLAAAAGEEEGFRPGVVSVVQTFGDRANRITFFDSLGGPYHGSNPVVSPDGRFAAVQLGIHGMGAGHGRGLVLIDLVAWAKTLAR